VDDGHDRHGRRRNHGVVAACLEEPINADAARDLRQLCGLARRPFPPSATLIGFTLTAVAPGEAVIELVCGPQHANPMGALHGGVLCDIADAAMGIAYAARWRRARPSRPCELKTNFLKPVWTAKLRPSGAS